MSNINFAELQKLFAVQFDELFCLESIIKLTKDVCLNYEITSQYYDLPSNKQIILSNERNHYINMLTIAEEKINKIKDINNTFEKELL